MKIIEPKVELWQQDDKIAHVARCARVCYKKETGNDNTLYGNLERSKHWSMFRHETYYAAINTAKNKSLIFNALAGYQHCPYIDYTTYNNKIYIVVNGNFIRDIVNDNPVLFNLIYDNQITSEEAEQIEPIWQHLMRYTFCVTTQISTSRELNRVSPNNIAEQSTRYVYEDGTLCRPHWMINDVDVTTENLYIDICKKSFNTYKILVDCGMKRQDARGVLPLDTATRCVYTYSIDEWRKIIDLRYYGTTGKPHPNAKIIAGMIRDELMNLSYNFRKE